jgi:hypothetical protein
VNKRILWFLNYEFYESVVYLYIVVADVSYTENDGSIGLSGEGSGCGLSGDAIAGGDYQDNPAKRYAVFV